MATSICNNCGEPFGWHRTFESRRAVRRTCAACAQRNSYEPKERWRRPKGPTSVVFSKFSRRMADGTRIQTTFNPEDTHVPSSAAEILRVGHVRPGCLLCSQPYSRCDCPPLTLLVAEGDGEL